MELPYPDPAAFEAAMRHLWNKFADAMASIDWHGVFQGLS
jgi:hypothetical protein